MLVKHHIPAAAPIWDAVVDELWLVRLYLTIRTRNAWHSTESVQYKGEGALATDLQTAHQAAEDWRAMGSQFQIREVCGLAFVGNQGAFVWTQTWEMAPFEKWGQTPHTEPAKSHIRQGLRFVDLQEVLRRGWGFRPPNQNSLETGLAEIASLERTSQERPTHCYESIPPGTSQVRLGWSIGAWTQGTGPAEALVDTFAHQSGPGAKPPLPLWSPSLGAADQVDRRRVLFHPPEAEAQCDICTNWSDDVTTVGVGRSAQRLCADDLRIWSLGRSRRVLRRRIAGARYGVRQLSARPETIEILIQIEDSESLIKKSAEILETITQRSCADCGLGFAEGAVWARHVSDLDYCQDCDG